MIEMLFLGAFIASAVGLVAMNWVANDAPVRHRVVSPYSTRDEDFLRSLGCLLGPSFVQGNEVRTLLNGDQIFGAMLEGIKNAEKSITFETFVFGNDVISVRFVEALCERARAGVKVHVLIDWIGGYAVRDEMFLLMRKSGVEVEWCRPLRWYNLFRLNNRTHRKILVIDGKVGFTGGVGIADKWRGRGHDLRHWRDSHFRLEGPAVAHLQAAFMDNWLKTSPNVLHGEEYFPFLEPAGSLCAQVFKSSSHEGGESVRLMYLFAIASARESIRIGNAYFIPDDIFLEEFVRALARGVKVEIVLPGTATDSRISRYASRARWRPLLESGARIYEYQPTMFHCKVMIVDRHWVSVGSTNFDNRSFRLNDEANLNILDDGFAEEQIRIFEEDKAKSKEMLIVDWKKRSYLEKLLGFVAAMFRTQL